MNNAKGVFLFPCECSGPSKLGTSKPDFTEAYNDFKFY